MASSLFLLASLSLAFLCACQADLISEVCSKAVNRPLCTQVLTSDPRSRGADLNGLAQIMIEKAKAAVQDAIRIVKSVKDPKVKGIVETCVETSNDAIADLKTCSKLIKNVLGSKSEIQAVGSAAMANVGTCDNEFEEKEPANVKAGYRKAQDLISILLVIINSM